MIKGTELAYLDEEELNKLYEYLIGQVMQNCLENFEKGCEKYGNKWQYAEPEYLERRFEEEDMEFRQALEHHGEGMMKELGDLVNFRVFYMIVFMIHNGGTTEELGWQKEE